jgi:hypothetical protein
MKNNTNNEELLQKDIADKYLVLYQVWKELTDFRTLDSYQYRIMNSLSAIIELVEVLNNRLRRVHTSNHNIMECKTETLGIIKVDPVLKKHYFTYWNTLINHLSEKTETDAQQRALRYQLEYIYNQIAVGYLEKLISELEDSLDNGDVNRIIENANRVVSCCVTRGWSTTALYDFVDILIGSKSDNCKWEIFKGKILKDQPEEYHVLIPMKVRTIAKKITHQTVEEKLVENINSMGIEVLDIDGLITSYRYINRNAFLSDVKYLRVVVSAFDFYSASHIALSKYANILNMFSFYNVIEAWSIKDISWTVVNANLQQLKKLSPKDLYGTYGYLEGAARILRESLVITQREGSLKARLNATYSYANMSKASYALEEKYMNMWVALESLCRSDVYENIISNVLETVPAALCNRYVYRKYRNFAEDCLRCGVDLRFTTQSYQIKNPNKNQLVSDMLLIFKDAQLYNELLDKCKVNSLLAYRCAQLHNQAVDGEKMVNAIIRHHKNVKQQLSRLYRIRNAIAHTAALEDVQMVRYIEHLEDYLSEFVSEIIRTTEEKNVDHIEIIFEMIKDNYQQFEDLVNGKKKSGKYLVLEDGLFCTGVLNLL